MAFNSKAVSHFQQVGRTNYSRCRATDGSRLSTAVSLDSGWTRNAGGPVLPTTALWHAHAPIGLDDNPLVALFFACQSELSEGWETKGKLFVLDALTLTGLWPERDGKIFGIATDQQSEFRDWVQTIVGGVADQRTSD